MKNIVVKNENISKMLKPLSFERVEVEEDKYNLEIEVSKNELNELKLNDECKIWEVNTDDIKEIYNPSGTLAILSNVKLINTKEKDGVKTLTLEIDGLSEADKHIIK